MFCIGLIDYYLDEWHANNYPRMLREEIAHRGLAMEVSYAYADCSKENGLTTDEWCVQQQCERMNSLEEITERSDALIILAPSFPELHEEMSHIPLKSGKPVYMDKIFAPDRKTGERIFSHASAHTTPLFSTSALRFSNALDDFRVGKGMQVCWCLTNGPNSFYVYAIHQMEMIQTIMGGMPERVKAFNNAGGRTLLFDYGDGRMAQMTQMDRLPFSISCSDANRSFYRPAGDNFFANLITAMVRFFEDGNPPVLPDDTLAVISMLTAGTDAMLMQDTWIKVI